MRQHLQIALMIIKKEDFQKRFQNFFINVSFN